MFVAISQDRLIDAVSLSTVCEPDVFDGKDCFKLGLQILGAVRGASSGTLRDINQQLFCSRQVTRFCTHFSSRRVADWHSFFWHLPVSESSTWIECLNSCLSAIQLDTEPPKTKQDFIRSFPRFFFSSLSRYIWTNNHMMKDSIRITLPVMLDMAPYAFLTKN
jgi:dTDP-4-dehydrorhamnose reductase